MNAQTQLMEHYRTWRRLTEREGAGLAANDWAEVARCQQGKEELQPMILQHTQGLPPGARDELMANGGELRSILEELIGLEASNDEQLRARRETMRAERLELRSARRNLTRVRHSYVPLSGPAWQSYS